MMNPNSTLYQECQYLSLLQRVKEDGELVENRTSIKTRRLIAETMRFDFKAGFPLLTTKKVYWKGVVHELLWFLSGDTNIKYLIDNNVHIWDDDAFSWYKKKWGEFSDDRCLDKKDFLDCVKLVGYDDFIPGYRFGDLGPVYGAQWRNWGTYYQEGPEQGDYYTTYRRGIIDQIDNLIDGLKNNPFSRRHILSAWNVAELNQMALPPCHLLSQFTIFKGKLWCQMYQRSCDLFLGVPFNIASYSLLTHMIAQCVGIEPGGFIWTGHDVHVYESHMNAIEEQITRQPYPFPKLELNKEIKDIDSFKFEDIKLKDYKCHKKISAPLVVD